MPVGMSSYLEDRRKFLGNRQTFPLDELAKYLGNWVAWSPDGTRIVASAANAEDLEERVRAAGEDFTRCVLEGIPDNDALLGGGLDGEDPVRFAYLPLPTRQPVYALGGARNIRPRALRRPRFAPARCLGELREAWSHGFAPVSGR